MNQETGFSIVRDLILLPGELYFAGDEIRFRYTDPDGFTADVAIVSLPR